MANDMINYPEIIDGAMRDVVREVLSQVARNGLPGGHHFFISYRTDHPGVQMSDDLRSRHPETITIVLQYQFWDLKVEDHRFTVMLSFNNVPEKLVVPFAALTAFVDPSVKFGLQFHTMTDDEEEDEENGDDMFADLPPNVANAPKTLTVTLDDEPKGKVIALDAFRKK